MPLAEITTLFWDIGGVILTNGWDRGSRKEAANTFHLDWEEFQDRHDLSFPAFDSGQITLNEYLDRTLFYRPRGFTREEFTAFMFAQSNEFPETRAILDKLTSSRKYFVGAINNEPLELNQYRIEAFDLRRNFLVFFSSCDDRLLNLEAPRRLGMNTIHHQNAEQLRSELGKYRVDV